MPKSTCRPFASLTAGRQVNRSVEASTSAFVKFHRRPRFARPAVKTQPRLRTAVVVAGEAACPVDLGLCDSCLHATGHVIKFCLGLGGSA